MARLLLLIICLSLGIPQLGAQLFSGGAKTEARLLLGQSAAKPGETVTAALELKMEPGWHTYWRNPGDAGSSTTVEWQLPEGYSTTPFQWPVPEKLTLSKLFAYVYDGTVLLPFEIKVPANAQPGPVTFKGEASWLECSDTTCVPQSGKISAQLVIGSEAVPSPSANIIEEWRTKIPKPATNLAVNARWESSSNGKSRGLTITWNPAGTISEPDFFPYESDDYAVQAKTEVIANTPEKVELRKVVELSGKEWPTNISGLLIAKSGNNERRAEIVNLHPVGGSVGIGATAANTAVVNAGKGNAVVQVSGGSTSLWVLLGLAFVGGLILNIMPCVLPVIALKILGFVYQSREHPRRVRELGIIYALGVIASFLVLAGVIIGVKSKGGDVSWGMQMQNPVFVMVMTIVIGLVTLNLFGVFEIILPGAAMDKASNLASREGRAGAFYNGILATMLATPCTAPALAFAVGSAITQPAYVIVLTFVSIAVGLALPYVILSWNPAAMRLLPKPGPWMHKFKVVMGFPMLATTVWLVYIASYHFGQSSVLWLGLFLVIMALAAWVWGQFIQAGAGRKGLAVMIVLALLAVDYFWILEAKLHWRNPVAIAEQSLPENAKENGIQWEKWSPERIAEARESGRPVFVDFTAVWCLTCQWNKESIESEAVMKKLKEMNTLMLVADFTSRSPVIAQELKKFNRAGVPMALLYPADPNAAPIMLPEILTPSIILNSLEVAQKSSKKSGTPKALSLR
ncbi:MAG: protein-disulfide reductase DsbD family protein [Verrucomicrobiota bacterium]